MGNYNGDGRLDLVGLEANQPHVGKDVLDLLLESFCSFLFSADAVARDLVDLLHDRLLTVPEHLPLMKLLLLLLPLLDAALPLLFRLLLVLVSPLL